MKHLSILAAGCILSCMLFALPAHAVCPANITNPLQILAGTAWGFQAFGVSFYGEGEAGLFTANTGTRGGVTIGILTITSSYNFFGTISRLETDTGTYQIFPDCSGGTFIFNLSAHPLAYDFWFINGGTQLYMVSVDNGKSVIVGTATKAP